jgi:hypothetical protein
MCRAYLIKAVSSFCDMLKSETGPSIIVFYYSGHGLVHSADSNHMMMCLDWDSNWPTADDEAASAAGYSVETAIRDIMKASPACRLVVLLDMCRMQTSKGDGGSSQGQLPGVKVQALNKSEVLTGYACQLHSPAEQDPANNYRNSTYTTYLLQVRVLYFGNVCSYRYHA